MINLASTTMKRFLFIVVATAFIMCLFACNTGNNNTENNNTEDNNYEPNPTGGFEIPGAVDFSDATEQQLAIYFDLAEEALEAYYMATMEQKPFPSFKISTTEDCQKLLDMRFIYESRYAKEVVNASFEVKDWKITDNSLWCKIQVIIEFRYPGADHLYQDGILSGQGEIIQLLIENPKKPAIADWYSGDKASFDMDVRRFDLDLSLKENWLSNQNIEDILSKAQKVIDNIR